MFSVSQLNIIKDLWSRGRNSLLKMKWVALFFAFLNTGFAFGSVNSLYVKDVVQAGGARAEDYLHSLVRGELQKSGWSDHSLVSAFDKFDGDIGLVQTTEKPSLKIVSKSSPAAKEGARQKNVSVVAVDKVETSKEIASGRGELTSELKVRVFESENSLQLSETLLSFPEGAKKIQVETNLSTPSALQIFVRDPNLASWSQKDSIIILGSNQETEIYFVYKSQMKILKLSPESDVSNLLADLKPANEFFNLSASHSAAGSLDNPVLGEPLSEKPIPNGSPQHKGFEGGSLDSINFSTLKLRIVDDRSYKGEVYPLVNVRVTIPNVGFSELTNGSGIVEFKGLPRNARFFIVVDDPRQLLILPHIFELETSSASREVELRVLRRFASEQFSFITGTIKRSPKASACLQIELPPNQSPRGLRVAADSSGDGPYYFNQLGFLDPRLDAMSDFGKFCYFNLEAGPLALSVFDGEQYFTTIPIGVHRSMHHELSVNLARLDGSEITINLVGQPSALEQTSGQIDAYLDVDAVDYYLFGDDLALGLRDSGKLELPEVVFPSFGRIWGLAESSEFESTVFSHSVGVNQKHLVAPLIPRGFFEDLALMANILYDPIAGVVLVEHGYLKGQGSSDVVIRLLDRDGRDVGEGFTFGDQTRAKAVFFNLEPGSYLVHVSTIGGEWIASDTVLVYGETSSYVQTGTKMSSKLSGPNL